MDLNIYMYNIYIKTMFAGNIKKELINCHTYLVRAIKF